MYSCTYLWQVLGDLLNVLSLAFNDESVVVRGLDRHNSNTVCLFIHLQKDRERERERERGHVYTRVQHSILQ